MSGPVLSVSDLSINYNASALEPAIEGITFFLNAGEVLGIVGESGAGKTTLGLALLGLLDRRRTAQSGEIRFQGDDLAGMDKAARNRMRGAGAGMIFQDARGSLDPAMPVSRQVQSLIKRHKDVNKRQAAAQAAALLDEVGINDANLRQAPYPFQLSGGLCQRAAIAAALACGPALLIADEPTSSLDTVTQARIVSLLQKERRERGLAVIFISHDLPLVASFADSILVLSQGKQMEQGPVSQVLMHPRSTYTNELISLWQKLSA